MHPHAPVHEAKGRQFDAVCLVIPADRRPTNVTTMLFEALRLRNDSEAKRVIYVAVTRAKMLLMPAIPAVKLPQCEQILQTHDVPFQVLNDD